MFFADMSIYSGFHAIQALKNWAIRLEGDCMLCGAAFAGALCEPCAASLERTPDAPADFAVSVFAYRFPLDRLIHRFKYSGDLAAGRWLAHRLCERVSREPRPQLVVVPPLTKTRLRERGFNPALELAKVVARELDVRCDARAVSRTHEAHPQAGLTRRERMANLRGAFRCDARVAGLDVVVVDDVVTTGATAIAMRRALRAAGAARVRLWTVARTPRPGR